MSRALAGIIQLNQVAQRHPLQLFAGLLGHVVYDLADDVVEPRLHVLSQMEGNFRQKVGWKLERCYGV